MNELVLAIKPDLNIKIATTTESKLTDSVKKIADAYVPGIEWTKSENIQPNVLINNPNLPIDSLDLWFLTYCTTRLAHIKQNRYPVHAACAGLDNYSLFVGHSGVGKTSVMLEMIKKYNWKVFSGNKTVTAINEEELYAVAGTSSITVAAQDNADYSDRDMIPLSEESYSVSEKKKISSIFLPQLNDGAKIIKQLSPQSALHTLFPYFLDAVNADTILPTGEVFDGSVDKQTKIKLATQLQQVLNSIPVYKLVGSMDFITQQIKELHK